MKMSVREARAQFARALSLAESGTRVTITKNGKPIAEIGPATPASDDDAGNFLERVERVWAEMGLKDVVDPWSDEEWLAGFNDPAWTREIFGPDYFDGVAVRDADQTGQLRSTRSAQG